MRSLKILGLSLAVAGALSGQAKASVYGYAVQTTDTYTFTGATVDASTIKTSSDNAATLTGYTPPLDNLVTGIAATSDAPKAYLGNGTAAENQTTQNGMTNAPYSRSDSYLNYGAAGGTGGLSSMVVAEGYLASAGNASSIGKATISGLITVNAGGSVTLTFHYTNNLSVSNTTGPLGGAAANYNYEFTISTTGVGGAVVYDSANDTTGSNNAVNNTSSAPTTGSFTQGPVSGTATFTATGLTVGQTYIATVTTQAGQTLSNAAVVPEPSTVAGVVMGLVAAGFGLRRRRAV